MTWTRTTSATTKTMSAVTFAFLHHIDRLRPVDFDNQFFAAEDFQHGLGQELAVIVQQQGLAD